MAGQTEKVVKSIMSGAEQPKYDPATMRRIEEKVKFVKRTLRTELEAKGERLKTRKMERRASRALTKGAASFTQKSKMAAKPMGLRQKAKTAFKATGKVLGGTERALERQIAMGGRRGALGAVLKGTSVFSKVGGPIGVAGDLLAVGMAAYTGAKAYGAHKELQRKKKYAEEKYGTVAKAIKTRKERTGR